MGTLFKAIVLASRCFPGLILVIMAFAFSGCVHQPDKIIFPSPQLKQGQEKPKKVSPIEMPQKEIIPASQYVKALSLASIAFQQNPANLFNAQGYLSVIEAYGEQPQATITLQPVVVLEYSRTGHNGIERVVSPFTMPLSDNDFSSLQQVMSNIDVPGYLLHDVELLVTRITPTAPLPVAGYDSMELGKNVNGRLERLLQDATPVTEVADVRVELQLSHFFTLHHQRDEAWLTLENAKQSLVAIARFNTLPDADINLLTRKLEEQEALLQKTMPYTLGF